MTDLTVDQIVLKLSKTLWNLESIGVRGEGNGPLDGAHYALAELRNWILEESEE